LKILAFVHAYLPDHMAGAETTLHDILRHLVSRGWQATVLLSMTKFSVAQQPYYVDGIQVLPYNENDPQMFNRIVSEYDVVISHLESSERAALVCRKANIPIVHLIHNTMWQTEGYLATGCDLAIYNTQWVADYHNEVNKSPLVRMARRADTDEAHIEFAWRYQSQWDWVVVHPRVVPSDYSTDGPHDCITMINLHFMKGPEVFYEMARRFPNEQFLGVIGGYGKPVIDDSLPNVEFIENTPNVRDEVYARTKIILMPSHYESFGRVPIEAGASGIPSVVSDTPGLRESQGPKGRFATTLDEFEEHIAALLSPKAYAAAQKQAKQRSQYWEASSLEDLASLDVALNKLIK